MRAMKRTVSVLLSLMLVLGMMTIGMSAVGAAETHKVNVKSNIGEDTAVDFTASSEQVTVTYKLKADLDIVNTQGVITYDPAVLKIASTNTAKTVMPNFESNRTVNLTKKDGRIPFNCSDFEYGYDFKTEAVFATVVFDILDASADTDVNLNVSILTASTALNTTSENDVALVDGDVVDSSKFTSATEAKVTPDVIDIDPKGFFDGHALNLQGRVGVMFYFQIPDAVKGRTVKAVLSSDFDEDVEVPLDSTTWSSYDAAYVGTYFVRSVNLADAITAKIYVDGQYVGEDDPYSAKTYIDNKIKKAGTSATLKNLLYALAEYGSSAQLYFQALNPSIDYHTDNLPNAGLNYTAPVVTADDIDAPAYTRPDYSSLGINNNEIYTSMILAADTGIEVDFGLLTTDRSKIDAANVTVKGVKADYEYHANYNEVAYTISNIYSNKYAEEYSVNFGNGLEYKISINNRLKNVLSKSSSSAEYKKLAAAMYTYGQAAHAHFGDAA